MSLVFNLVINSYSILLLAIIYFHSRKNTGNDLFKGKIFRYMVIFTTFILVVDVLGRFDGHPDTLFYPLVNHTANFLLFITNLTVPSFWLAYVHYQIYNDEAKTRRLLIPLLTLNIINVGFVIASQFTGWLYSFDSGNIYHRGPYFDLSAMPTSLLILISILLLHINRRKVDRRTLFALLFFVIPPCVGTVLQLMVYGLSLVYNSIVMSLLIIHLYTQNQSLNTDYLTEISNRKKFEALLNEKVKLSTPAKSFSLIMLDFDNFKTINDTLGHDTGDDALRSSAKMFKSSIREKDFVARIGGDEFCFILDISEASQLNSAVARINNRIDAYNKSSNQPYQLCFSMGYDVYPAETHMKTEDFLKHVDTLMYEDKRKRKSGNRDDIPCNYNPKDESN
jgi:diguanylate cyclase (GGDEF)-like protein